MRRTAARLLVVVVAVTMAMAGCTSDEPAPSTTTTTATAPTTRPATTTVAPTTTTAPVAALVVDCAPGAGPDLRQSSRRNGDFDGADLSCARLDGVRFRTSSWEGVDAAGASFAGAELGEAAFTDTDLMGADLTDAALGGAVFAGADLRGAVLAGADLAGAGFTSTLCPDGVDSDEGGGSCDGHLVPLAVEFMPAADPAQAPLALEPLCVPGSGPDYAGAELDGTSFRRNRLACAVFAGATLTGIDFTDTDLQGASFAGAVLDDVTFDGASLIAADFGDARLVAARFSGADLSGADLRGAVLGDVRWRRAVCPNGVAAEAAGGTCASSLTSLDLPAAAYEEVTDDDITVREGRGVVTYTMEADVLFRFAEDRVTRLAEAKLAQIAGSIARRFATATIEVWGHADAIGDEAANLALSQRRADNVAALLRAAPVLAGYDITAIGLGESQPIAPDTFPDGSDNPEGRALNRRVEVVVRPLEP